MNKVILPTGYSLSRIGWGRCRCSRKLRCLASKLQNHRLTRTLFGGDIRYDYCLIWGGGLEPGCWRRCEFQNKFTIITIDNWEFPGDQDDSYLPLSLDLISLVCDMRWP